MTSQRLTQGIPAHLRPEFESERRSRTVEAVWGVNIIALCMYPPTTLLDWISVPQHYGALSAVRFAETGALLVNLLLVYWMRRTGRAERWAYFLAWLLAMVIAVSLDLFMVIVGGPGTTYYGGLTLLLTAILVAYPWAIVRTAVLILAVILQCNAVLLLADPGWPWIHYFEANYFYIGTAFIGLVWRLTSERLHQSEFLERKKAESGRANLAVTLHSIGDAVITTDTRGRVEMLNRVAGDLTGWRPDEAQGQPLPEVFRTLDSRSRKPAPDPVGRVLGTGRADATAHLVTLVARDGVERIVEQTAAPIRDGESAVLGVAIAFRDVSARLKMEEELSRAHKLESVGLLAGGIAHDFNNFLTSIWGSVALARSDASPDHPSAHWLSEAEKAVMRARDLTQQLLTFSKGGAPIRKTARIGDLISDSAGFSLRGSNVRCELVLPDDLWPADVDASQVSQVISDLVINADEAMPDGGTIRIVARNLDVRDPRPSSLPPGRYVRISVSDTGVGIAPDHLSRVFDPYFTTKKKGSGLGLAICFSILVKHDGTLTVESQPGRGATFHVFLPASDGPAAAEPAEASVVHVGQGRALVMDDDESIRELCGQILLRLGYEFVTVADGAEAIETFAQAHRAGLPFDVVILDLTVPGGMGGREAAGRILEIDPDARLIVSSGYSTDPIMSEYRAHGFRGVIPKPYEPAMLSRTLRDVLAERAATDDPLPSGTFRGTDPPGLA